MCRGHGSHHFFIGLVIKIERFAGRHEAREALVLIEKTVREYLRGKPQALRLLLERHCDAIEREDAESVEAKIGP